MAEVHDVLAYKKQSNFRALWEEFQAQGRFAKVFIFFTFLVSISTMALAGTSLTLINYAAEPISTMQAPQQTLLAYGGNRRSYWTNNYPTPTPTPTPVPIPTITPITNTATTNFTTTTTPTPTITLAPAQTLAVTPTITPVPAQTSIPTANSMPTTTPTPTPIPTPTPTPTQNAIQQAQQSVVSTIDNLFHIPTPTYYSSPQDSLGNDSSIPLPQTPTPIPTNITPRETNFFKFAFDVIAKANNSVVSLAGNLFSSILTVIFPSPIQINNNP